jgi:hypothetical protein
VNAGVNHAFVRGMHSTPAVLLLERCFPLLGAAAFVALSLWIGTLFSVSWVSGHARWMADEAEVGAIATGLCRRWATPFLASSIVLSCLFVALAPGQWLGTPQLIAVGIALTTLLVVHASIWRRAWRVARGSARATRGEGMRRVALVLSLMTLLAVVGFRMGAP